MNSRKFLYSISLTLLLLIFAGCTNYYNEMVAWCDNLERGLDVEEVKKLQPDYLEIAWESPLVIDDEKWYLITNIDWNWDPLSMSNYLVFNNDGYMYRESKK